ncbi:DUF421 domain-containing protein [Deinococcus hopiensis]|uniref:Uncharacterized membrane protein YcaP, DUF421 family n=1 Tax=Deinococcus hopiensis KR-140 TaxID=695939 RepID=A0A1W1VP12_9DEIO|nr:YetF domain-containing protein [Deinococcus hopiensis]SMB94970.1 Uncharacterized membrane protein YcaP, DUF421 family [Deinococcus hopiensis KR-140]
MAGRSETQTLWKIDWHALITPQVALPEIVLRGTLMYLALFLILRLVLKRESSGLGVTDLLVVVLIADAAQNALAADYRSVPEGILLVLTIIFWSWFLNWLGYHVPLFERLVHPPPLPLVRGGTLLRRNMRQELITETELLSLLREQGVDDLAEVQVACMEGDGSISVITRGRGAARSGKDRQWP